MCPLSLILLMHVTLGYVMLNEIINRFSSTVISLYYGYGPCHRNSHTAKDGPVTNFNKTPSLQKLSMRSDFYPGTVEDFTILRCYTT